MIFLHIGLNKTGSSSMQQFAAMNRALLAEAGILYPEVGTARHAHHLFKNELTAIDAGAAPGPVIAAIAELVASRPEATFLFSSEGLSQLEEPGIAALAAACRSHKVRVFFYVRDFTASLMSMYNQQAKTGRTILDFDRFVAHSRGRGRTDLGGRARLFAHHFGAENLRVRSTLPADLAGGDLIVDFCAAIGLPESFVDRTPPESRAVANASVRWEVAEFVRAFTAATVAAIPGWSDADRAEIGEARRLQFTDATVSADPAVPAATSLRVRRMADVCEAALRAAASLPRPPQYMTAEDHAMLDAEYREAVEALRAVVPDHQLTRPPVAAALPPRPFLPDFRAIRPAERNRMTAALRADLPSRRLPASVAALLDALYVAG